MAIVTDQTITIHGVSVGISKPIQTLIANGDFTYAELSKFAFVGRYDFVNDKCGGYATAGAAYGDSQTLITEGKFPVLNDPTANWDSVKYVYTGIGERKNDNYGKMVLVYNRVNSDNNINRQYNDDNTACIVTEINPRLLKVICTIYQATVEATKGTPGTYTVYEPESSINIVWYDDDSTAPFSTLCCQKFTDVSYFVFPLYNNVFYAQQNINGNRSGTGAEVAFMYDSFELLGNHNFSSWASSDVTDIFMQGADYSAGFVGAMDISDGRGDKLLTVNYNPYSAEVKVRASSLDTALKQCAAQGLYFEVNGTVYKPITEDGIVTGYTANLTKNSEWDLINDVTGNTVPDTPSGGGGGSTGDDYADMSLGVSNVTLGGLTKYAILSKQELIDLVIDYNTNQATAGTNFSNHIICLYRLGFGASDLVVTGSDKIKMIQSSGNVDFESSANYSIVTRQTPFIHFGSIKVPRHTNTFYDFSPYSNYELYIPGCGWIPLPDNVAGRTLNVYLVFDLPTCSAKGIVRIEGGVYGGTTIATVNGIIGASVPFTIGENGMQRAAILSGSVQTAAALGTAFLGVGTGNLYMGASGVAMAANGIASNYVAGNTNFISTKGGASDFSAFGDGATAMLKYNSPEIDPVVNNTMFGHTVGYLCNEVGTLGSFTGFTVCDNPHVTFSASSAERDEIERLLSSGVIL